MSKEASICDQCGEYDHECLCAETTLSKMQSELARLRKIEAAAKGLFEADETHPFDSYFLPVESMRALRDALKGNNP